MTSSQQAAFWRQLVQLALSDAPPAELLADALELVLSATGSDRGLLELQEWADEAAPRWRTARDLSASAQDEIVATMSTGILAEALGEGRSVRTAMARTDPRYADRASVVANEIDAVLCTPIGSPPRGAVYLQRPASSGPYSDEDERWVEVFAEHLATIAGRMLSRLDLERSDDPTLPWRRRLGGVDLVGRSQAFADTLKAVALVAPMDMDVLLVGPTGSGKNAIAELLARRGLRADGPFLDPNCAAIAPTLFESELFGAVRGAHSTAQRAREGLVGAAKGGTLFLDEIGELDLSLQAKLLQLLQSRRYFPVGSAEPRTADLRIIAATNRDLEQEVAEGRFREDLYYRLSVFTVPVPGLDERREDLPDLLRAFVRQACRRFRCAPLTVAPGAEAAVLGAPWPGNLRQLENAVARAVVFATGEGRAAVEAHHLFPGEEVVEGNSFQDATRRFQRQLLVGALQRNGWNVTRTAKELELTRSHLYNLIQSHGLKR